MYKYMKASKFLNRKQKSRIIQAIVQAENVTSGEIKLHIENHCPTELLKRAKEVFHLHHMHQTEKRNGVLIYMALRDKKVGIVGDRGIDELIPENYWQEEVDMLLGYFKQSEFTTGLVTVITRIGEKLQKHFPIEENDVNELPDEITFFDN